MKETAQLNYVAFLTCFWTGCLLAQQPAFAGSIDQYVEFRDSVKPDTVPSALFRQGRITVQPWKAGERTKVKVDLETVYRRAPGLFRLAAAQGAIPLYRIKGRNSFGGHGALWLSYFGTNVIAHELTHVADAEHKIARSLAFRKLVEAKITKLRAAMHRNGISDLASSKANKRKDLYQPIGLPTAYAATTIQETLAEYVRALVLTSRFKPPADVKRFVAKMLIRAKAKSDPSVHHYRKGKRAQLNRDYRSAYIALTKAIQHDKAFAEAYIERGLTLARVKKPDEAIRDFTIATGLMSEYDWHSHLPYQYRGNVRAARGQYEEALKDYQKARHLSPKAPRLEAAIRQVRFMIKMTNQKQK